MQYNRYVPYLFILPTVIGIVLFRLGPLVASFFISFTDWNIRTAPEFVGLANYAELFASEPFRIVLGNTLFFAAVYVPGVMILALACALLVNQKIKGIAFFRGLYFMPYITSMVAVAAVWQWIFANRGGLLNAILRQAGFANPPSWLGDADTTLLVLIIVTIWKTFGFPMMIFLAGLQEIPQNIYDAARVDGANRRQIFFRITLPLLSPITFLVLILTIIAAFQTFEVTIAITRGGPLYASSTLSFYIYQNAFEFYRMGFASSIAYVLMAIVSVVIIFNYVVRRRWVTQQNY